MKTIYTLAILVMFVVGCQDSSLNSQNDTSLTPLSKILDAASSNGGNEYFYFLPPMVNNPTPAGVFDPGLSPVVQVQECLNAPGTVDEHGDYLCNPDVTILLSSGMTLSSDDELYQYDWDTKNIEMNVENNYRITIRVQGKKLGFADIEVAASGNELKNIDTDEMIALKDGRTLPIKVRIEEYVLGFVSSNGGEAILQDGNVIINVPAGSIEEGQLITAEPAEVQEEGIISGSAYDITMNNTNPVTVTLAYSDAGLTETYENSLIILQYDGMYWEEIGGMVNTATNTVTADVPHLGKIAVGAAASLSISSPADEINIGETLQLTAMLADVDGNELTGRKPIIWESSNPSAASVDDNGLVTAIAEGVVTITANSNDVSDAVEITVLSATTFTDARDGQVYQKVTIGTQTWMAEQLNYLPESGLSSCPGDFYTTEPIDEHCETRGRLYSWDAVVDDNHGNGQDICPEGWHLPSDEDWKLLEAAAGMLPGDVEDRGTRGYNDYIGTKLKSTTGWLQSEYGGVPGTDDFGFNLLPPGYKSLTNGIYYDFGKKAMFWSSTDFVDPRTGIEDSRYAWYRQFDMNHNGIYRNKTYKINKLISVRCVED